MTPAVQLLKKHKLDFELLSYPADPAQGNFGQASATKLGVAESQVFKTLLACDEQQPQKMVVAMIPVDGQLDLKRLAKAAGFKKMKMCELAQAERVTGYVQGGISPLGQKKVLPSFIDETALTHSSIYLSAGKRGLSLKLSFATLASCLKVKALPIASY